MSPTPSEQTALLRTPTNRSARRTYISFPPPSISSSISLITISQTIISNLLLALPYVCIPSAFILTLYFLLKTPTFPLALHSPLSPPPPTLPTPPLPKPILCAFPALAVSWLVVHIFDPVEKTMFEEGWITERMRQNFRNFCAFVAGGLCAAAVGWAL